MDATEEMTGQEIKADLACSLLYRVNESLFAVGLTSSCRLQGTRKVSLPSNLWIGLKFNSRVKTYVQKTMHLSTLSDLQEITCFMLSEASQIEKSRTI